MKNNVYFIVLVILIIVLLILRTWVFTTPPFLFISGGILVFYIWCKDIFTGSGWFQKKAQPKPAAGKVDHTFEQFTETAVAQPLSINEKQGFLQLMRELVAPAFHEKLEPVINNLKTFDDSTDEFEPLYSLGEFTDEEGIAFISMLDWKAAIEDLVWRKETALKQNYDTVLELPSEDQWEPRASISYDNVFKTYDDTLRQHGFQLGFMNTGGDDFALLVFKTTQKDRVEEAVKLTGYGYYEITN
jgi:hypothetical protein